MDAAAIVDKDDVHFLSWPGPAEMTGIGSDRLAGSTTRQQTQKNTQVPPLRDDLFNTHTGNVYIGQVSAHIGIALIGTYDEFPGFGNGEVNTGKRDTPRQEFLPEVQPCGVREELRIGIAGGGTQVFVKYFADLLL